MWASGMVLAALGIVLTAGCGVGERGAEAAAAADRFMSTLDTPQTACSLLSPEARDAVVGEGEACAEGLAALDLPHGRISDTAVWSHRARVRTSDGALFLVELDTGWRVTAAGCVPAEADTYDCVLES